MLLAHQAFTHAAATESAAPAPEYSLPSGQDRYQ